MVEIDDELEESVSSERYINSRLRTVLVFLRQHFSAVSCFYNGLRVCLSNIISGFRERSCLFFLATARRMPRARNNERFSSVVLLTTFAFDMAELKFVEFLSNFWLLLKSPLIGPKRTTRVCRLFSYFFSSFFFARLKSRGNEIKSVTRIADRAR